MLDVEVAQEFLQDVPGFCKRELMHRFRDCEPFRIADFFRLNFQLAFDTRWKILHSFNDKILFATELVLFGQGLFA